MSRMNGLGRLDSTGNASQELRGMERRGSAEFTQPTNGGSSGGSLSTAGRLGTVDRPSEARSDGRARKPYHVLTREDRAKGGTRSASTQGRDQYGQFAGRGREQKQAQQTSGTPADQMR
jgi:hypothetical protein